MNYLKNLVTGEKVKFSPIPEDFASYNPNDLSHTNGKSSNTSYSHALRELKITTSYDYESGGDNIKEVLEFYTSLKDVSDDSIPQLELAMDKLRLKVFITEMQLSFTAFAVSGEARALTVDMNLIIIPDPSESQSKMVKRDIDWLKVAIVDEAGKPVPNIGVLLIFGDGTTRTARSNEKGFIDVKDATRGSYTLRLIDRDETSVEGKHGVHEPENKDKIEHIVEQGESLSSIAAQYGLPWKTIWEDPDNKELKNKRKNPDILYPMDILFIPPVKHPEYKFTTASEQKITVKSNDVDFMMILETADGPLKNTPCELDLGNERIIKLTSDSAGEIKTKINPAYKEGILRVKLQEDELEFVVKFSHLDPVEEKTGTLQRISNMGLPVNIKDEENAGLIAQAFLGDRDEETSEEFDEDTSTKIKKIYGV